MGRPRDSLEFLAQSPGAMMEPPEEFQCPPTSLHLLPQNCLYSHKNAKTYSCQFQIPYMGQKLRAHTLKRGWGWSFPNHNLTANIRCKNIKQQCNNVGEFRGRQDLCWPSRWERHGRMKQGVNPCELKAWRSRKEFTSKKPIMPHLDFPLPQFRPHNGKLTEFQGR